MKNHIGRIIGAILLICSLIMGSLTGCAKREKETDSLEKLTITMMQPKDYYDSDIENTAFEKLVESVYKDIDLQIEYFESRLFSEEQEYRLKKGDASDLIITTMPTHDKTVPYMLDLSAEEFVTRYDKVIMSYIESDSNIYFIPLMGQYYGYIYNRTIFEENGQEEPHTWQDLKKSLRYFLENKVLPNEYDGAPMEICLKDYHVMGYYVLGTAIPDFLSNPQGIHWLKKLVKGQAGYTGSWEAYMKEIQGLVDSGIISKKFMNIDRDESEIVDQMAEGKLALTFDTLYRYDKIISRNQELTASGESTSFEYRMLPFLSNQENEPWIISIPEIYIGINGSIQKDEKKRNACLRIMDLLSTEEGQNAFNETLAGNQSYLNDCTLTNAVSAKGVEEVVEKENIYNITMPRGMVAAIGRYTYEMLDGKNTVEECLALIDLYIKGEEEENEK